MLDLVERVEVLANMLRGAVESVWDGAAKEKGGARSLGGLEGHRVHVLGHGRKGTRAGFAIACTS